MSDEEEAERRVTMHFADDMPRGVAAVLQPPPYDPEARRNAYEDQIVGPHGETRAQMRVKMLGQLDDLEEFVTARWQEGTLESEDAVRLSLRIHRERCGLLGIPAGVGEPW